MNSTIKLGLKTEGVERSQAWFVATELHSDIVVEVKDVKFYLHKFPLLSRSGLLNRLVFECRDTQKNRIQLDGIPGGPDAFELAAKFCYGMYVDMDSSNVAPLWCAAAYLEMTDALEQGNLVSKAESFFNTVVLPSWKDSVNVLHSCVNLFPWAERLLIVQRCTESIAWKACTDTRGGIRSPSGYSSRTGSRAHSPTRRSVDGSGKREFMKEWWFDDVMRLPVDYFVKVMGAIKVKGLRIEVYSGAVALYALTWLPRKSELEYGNHHQSVRSDGKALLERILGMLPRGKDLVPSRFLMHLIRVAHLLEVDLTCKMDLEQRAGLQLESASLSDLLVPALDGSSGMKLDVDLVQRILQYYLRQDTSFSSSRPHSVTNLSDKVRVANLVDSFLAEASQDRHFTVSKFKSLAETLPDVSRLSHDGLYAAIDVFLKVHPELADEERKNLCQVLDCKRLSLQSSMHAAQNERLPLRTVMQVLYFEHLKLKNPTPFQHRFSMDGPPRADGCAAALQHEIRTIRCELEQMKAEFVEFQNSFRSIKEVQVQEKQRNVVVSKLRKLGVRIY